MKQSKCVEEPHHDANDNHCVQNRLDGTCHRDELVDLTLLHELLDDWSDHTSTERLKLCTCGQLLILSIRTRRENNGLQPLSPPTTVCKTGHTIARTLAQYGLADARRETGCDWRFGLK
jgi:hypothetical protein